MSDQNNNEGENTILVIGDWFIDENWLMTKHYSSTSTHTGDTHYISKYEKIGKRMTSLCGVPEILESLRSNLGKNYSFIGSGVWNSHDSDILRCILCPDVSNLYKERFELMTPYTIKGLKDVNLNDDTEDNEIYPPRCPYKENDEKCDYQPKLINLASKETEIESSTNHVIRVFEGYGGGEPNILYRFDWEIPPKKLYFNKLIENINSSNIVAIVIEDHDKGVMTIETIEKIFALGKDKLENIKWYIRSKKDNPPWFENLVKRLSNKSKKIRLRVINDKVAVNNKGPRNWLYGKELGRASLELLGELSGDQIYKHGEELFRKHELTTERIAVLFDDNKLIAKENKRCFSLSNRAFPKQLINIGRTTRFFSELIYQDIFNQYNSDFYDECYKAQHCAFDWTRTASQAWNNENLFFWGDFKTNKLSDPDPDKKIVDYNMAWKHWNDSSSNLGIISVNEKEILQVWRGQGGIEEYICVGGPKRDRINKMLSSISNFNNEKNPKHSFNCVLVSTPGWGKSFLAKSLAKHFNMSFMEFSLSQMATSNDLVDCFDSICSHQNRTEKRLLIFMDEVNCEIEGHSALSLLLSPIWDGSFIRDGKYYLISPAVWIFASTEPIDKLIGNENNKKGSDFVSRLNGPIIELDTMDETESNKDSENLSEVFRAFTRKIVLNPDLDVSKDDIYSDLIKLIPKHMKTDQVYLGVILLQRFWGPISKIEKAVLQLFHDIVPINGVRSIEFFISKFQYVQRGIVKRINVPMFENFAELKRHIILPPEWMAFFDIKSSKKEEFDPETIKIGKEKYDINDLIEVETLADLDKK
jgi:hypothetical protein